MNNMKSEQEKDFKFTRRAVYCIAIGTGAGILVYALFLYFHIDIFGWNLGLIFAPLAAGYVETIVANKMLGENLGAISAFILFIDTVIYSFILKNPTLGLNFITAGSILVILQAAFPTVVNYILLVVVGSILSRFIRRIKRRTNKLAQFIKEKNIIHWEGEKPEIIIPPFDEYASNNKLNSLDFYFLTSSDMKDRKHDVLGLFHSEVVIERNEMSITSEPEIKEKIRLNKIKESKDECLIKLSQYIKENGGNGVLDLTMNYSLIGFGNDNIQITAMGMGIKIPPSHII